MAYNRKNFLLRVKEINEIYKRESAKAVPTDYIFRNFIEEQFHISRATFYNFLNIPYERDLKDIARREAEEQRRSPTLFDFDDPT